MTDVKWYGLHRVIYCFGDEGVQPLDRLSCENVETGALYSCRVEAKAGLRASDALDGSGASLNQDLLIALASQSVILHVHPNGEFGLLWDVAEHAGNFASGSGTLILPVLLFHLGMWDARDEGAHASPKRARERLRPYATALRLLKARGFRDTFACRIRPDQSTPAVEIFNEELTRLMDDNAVALIDPPSAADPRVALTQLILSVEAASAASRTCP
jgi:hypothetical protein